MALSMKISLFSNFLNSHQIELCNAFLSMNDVDFSFISIVKQQDIVGRRNLDDDYPFVIKAYEPGGTEIAIERAVRDDIVLFGDLAGHEEFIKARAATGRRSFRIAERILKRGLWWRFLPPKALRTYDRFLRHKSNCYILCASGYTSLDLTLSGYPPSKLFKWGYFTHVPKELEKPTHKQISVLWTGRLIQWKRPDWALALASRAAEEDLDIHVDIVGDGPLKNDLAKQIDERNLNEIVTLHGELDHESTLSLMLNADVFLFTSNRQEGWGAVLSEAMAYGCCPIASNSAGATPFLVKHNVNGIVFNGRNINEFLDESMAVLNNRKQLTRLAEAARLTMEKDWNATTAAKRIIALNSSLEEDSRIPFSEGPCSLAEVISE